jgi:prevent-host-death family protein
LANLARPVTVAGIMQVNILEAKNQLSRLVKAAAAGREIVIASNGKPMAKLVPLAPRRRLGGWRAIELSQAKIDAAFTPEVEERVARSLRGKR